MFANPGMMNFLDGATNGSGRRGNDNTNPMHHQHPGNNPSMVNLMPTSGHQMDLNHLWAQVQELSSLLASNRESTAQLFRRADQIKVCHFKDLPSFSQPRH